MTKELEAGPKARRQAAAGQRTTDNVADNTSQMR
jgi:hypothetical protein